MQIHPWIDYIAGVFFMSIGVLSLIGNAAGWKKFRRSGVTIIFLSEKRWDEPIAKILTVVWGLLNYSVGFWILMRTF